MELNQFPSVDKVFNRLNNLTNINKAIKYGDDFNKITSKNLLFNIDNEIPDFIDISNFKYDFDTIKKCMWDEYNIIKTPIALNSFFEYELVFNRYIPNSILGFITNIRENETQFGKLYRIIWINGIMIFDFNNYSKLFDIGDICYVHYNESKFGKSLNRILSTDSFYSITNGAIIVSLRNSINKFIFDYYRINTESFFNLNFKDFIDTTDGLATLIICLKYNGKYRYFKSNRRIFINTKIRNFFEPIQITNELYKYALTKWNIKLNNIIGE